MKKLKQSSKDHKMVGYSVLMKPFHESFTLFRSSHRRCSIKKGIVRNFAKFTRKYLCQSLFFNKSAGLRPKACNFIEKETRHRCFPANFSKFLTTPFLQNNSGRLLLVYFARFSDELFCVSIITRSTINK